MDDQVYQATFFITTNGRVEEVRGRRRRGKGAVVGVFYGEDLDEVFLSWYGVIIRKRVLGGEISHLCETLYDLF